jgi:hypothetical protein
MPGWSQVLQYNCKAAGLCQVIVPDMGISPKHKQTNKQTKNIKTKNKKKILTTVIPLLNRGAMTRAAGADVVLVQLMLNHSG